MTPIRKTTAFLYFILNESPQQIADKLQVNIKTIQKRIERTKHQLKSRLIKKYGDHELIKELS
jgi:DNA-directed RNA polymerase specialized sigma24 family protein